MSVEAWALGFAVILQTSGFAWWASRITSKVSELDGHVNDPESGLRASRHEQANLLSAHAAILHASGKDIQEIKHDVKEIRAWMMLPKAAP